MHIFEFASSTATLDDIFVTLNDDYATQKVHGSLILHETLNLNNAAPNTGGLTSSSPGIYVTSFAPALSSRVQVNAEGTGAGGEIVARKDTPGFFINTHKSTGKLDFQNQSNDALVINNDRTASFKHSVDIIGALSTTGLITSTNSAVQDNKLRLINLRNGLTQT